jgi:serine/threonine protein kinase/cytochrome c-type biogenesis protein CcmH/NrfG
MKPESWRRITDLYHETIARRPEERSSFLEQACNGDEELRTQVERLVRSHEQSGDFIDAPAFETAPELLMGEPAHLVGQRIGHYRIESLLGRGGMGEVYLAHDEQLGRKVALKILPERLTADETQLNRFKREARTASALNHPNILTVHEIGVDGSRHFIATEFIEGETLRSAMARGRLNLRETLDIGVQVGSALAAAHKSGVLHRDIKPENIMLRPDAYIKVLDFGIAKLVEQKPAAAHVDLAMTLTEKGMLLGTTHYMSPEQARGQPVDARTDIWSFGVVLYEMIAGVPPFKGETPSDCIAALLKTEPAPLTLNAPDVPGRLEEIVQKALRKDRDERYQSVDEMLTDLRDVNERLETGEKLPAAAPPPRTMQTTSSAEYIVNEMKQHKRGVVMALLLIIVVAGGLAFYSFSARGDSLAVLPFAYVSAGAGSAGDPSSEYLSDGLTEALIYSLSRVPKLKVISRSSTSRYKGKEIDPKTVGRELGVRTIVTGRIMQRGDNLSISAELVSAPENRHIWGEQLERKLSTFLAVPRDIAKEISDHLRVRLTGEDERRVAKRPTENAQAYQLYLQGRYFWAKRDEANLKKSIEYYEQAIAKDLDFALAYSGLANSYHAIADYSSSISSREWKLRSKAATMKALELDDSIAEVHVNLANVNEQEGNFAGAENEYRRAIELNPNYPTAHQWYSTLLSLLGRQDEALGEARRASELDPLSPVMRAGIAIRFFEARQYDKAIEAIREVIAMDKNYAQAHVMLAENYLEKGMYEEAIAEFETWWKLSEEKSPGEAARRAAVLRDAYRTSGPKGYWQKELELALEETKQKHVEPQILSAAYARLGDKENAFEWLEKAYEAREDMTQVPLDPAYDGIRSDSRFADLLRRIGLPSATASSARANHQP